jgi:hypothetical protein
MALVLLGQNPIADISDTSVPNAVKMNAVYAAQRDALLREYDWSFARVGEPLQAVPWTGADECSGGLPAGYPTGAQIVRHGEVRYQKPQDCLRVLTVNRDRFGWRIEGQYIVTAMSPAYCTYIMQVTEPGLFDSLFAELLSIKLAHLLAIPITKDQAKQNAMAALYKDRSATAKRVDASEGKDRNEPRTSDSSWVQARDGGYEGRRY